MTADGMMLIDKGLAEALAANLDLFTERSDEHDADGLCFLRYDVRNPTLFAQIVERAYMYGRGQGFSETLERDGLHQ